MRRKFDIQIKHNNAAIKLQKWWKRNRPSVRPKYDLAKVTTLLQKIKLIQQFWRGYLQMKKDKANLKYYTDAARKIQKAFREAYVFRRNAQFQIMNDNYKYFEKLRRHIERNAAVFITYHWKKYLRKKQKKNRKSKNRRKVSNNNTLGTKAVLSKSVNVEK